MSASTDLAVMLNHCIEECEELRELNAELLATLKEIYKDRSGRVDAKVREVIAKAEK